MKIVYGTPKDIDLWMHLVNSVFVAYIIKPTASFMHTLRV